jgi:RimJ/RimL family protein N-acetyltransferase
MTINPTDANFIAGERIDLVPQTPDHAQIYVKWWNNAEVRKYSRNEFPTSIDDVKERIKTDTKERRCIFFEIWHRADKKPIGLAGIHSINWISRVGLIGLEIGEIDYWKSGYATEVAKLLIDYAFGELNLHKLAAQIFSPNIGSQKAAEKSGLKFETALKEEVFIDGKYYDTKIYSIFARDWKK